MGEVTMAPARLVPAAFAAALAFGLAACGAAGISGAVGPCELVVHAMKGGKDVVLQPPYQTSLDHRARRDDVAISFSGSGWGETHVFMAGPGKSVGGTLDAERINTEFGQWTSTVWFADAPGTWHFRLTSGPCVRTVDVEVKP
jgi:hypothetical protein